MPKHSKAVAKKVSAADETFVVEMDALQMRMIYQALRHYHRSCQSQLSPRRIEELEALIEMSDLDHSDKEIRPHPGGVVNGWCFYE